MPMAAGPCLAYVALSPLSYALVLYFWGARAQLPPSLFDESEEAWKGYSEPLLGS